MLDTKIHFYVFSEFHLVEFVPLVKCLPLTLHFSIFSCDIILCKNCQKCRTKIMITNRIWYALSGIQILPSSNWFSGRVTASGKNRYLSVFGAESQITSIYLWSLFSCFFRHFWYILIFEHIYLGGCNCIQTAT